MCILAWIPSPIPLPHQKTTAGSASGAVCQQRLIRSAVDRSGQGQGELTAAGRFTRNITTNGQWKNRSWKKTLRSLFKKTGCIGPLACHSQWWRRSESARILRCDTLWCLPGAHPRGGGRAPLGPEKHYIFRVSSVKLRDLHL